MAVGGACISLEGDGFSPFEYDRDRIDAESWQVQGDRDRPAPAMMRK
ncbi:hypothetical protein [Microcoleus sp. N9_A1]